ncbi:methyltransferase domain-containing protein [Actinoplanes sp. NBRC 103695]|uniref:methyltransferase domain-containing protein n=1 Tax=Actinoplanes sp. NBRC 103695 TaxID=3032202 RepID=UPI0024A5DC6A|nr:methyltransferase domain-containing protein [Actinoplanes sp. NBRC 103695]GLY99812.1 hypothetical protein Acsp02_70650 [Actinoplanes sp. NBRC 103695]
MFTIAELMAALPREVYTDHARYGATVHRTCHQAIARELTALDVQEGHRVLEVGTGSGYTGALLAQLVGPDGNVTSVDISAELTDRARRIHAERGVRTVDCRTGDGLAGHPGAAPYDRIVAWLTPPRLPQALVAQLAVGGRLVSCLPITELPYLTVVATIAAVAGEPQVDAMFSGGYVQSRTVAGDDLVVPHRWADWVTPGPNRSWVSVSWRDHDDPDRTGARTTLHRLLHPGHTEPWPGAPMDWDSWNAFSAALGEPGLSTVDLRGRIRAIGHSSPRSVAMVQVDGAIIADRPDSPSLPILHTWLRRWEKAGRPDASQLAPALHRVDNASCPGWDLRVSSPLPPTAAARSVAGGQT